MGIFKEFSDRSLFDAADSGQGSARSKDRERERGGEIRLTHLAQNMHTHKHSYTNLAQGEELSTYLISLIIGPQQLRW